MSDLPTRERRPGGGGEGSRHEAAGQQLHFQDYAKRPAGSTIIDFLGARRTRRLEPYRASIRTPVYRQGRLIGYRWIRVSRELALAVADMAEARR
jgi:hypothetical protein